MEGKVTAASYSEEKGFKFPKGLDWVEQVAVYGGQAGARGRVAPVRGANSSQTFHINSCSMSSSCFSHFLALLNLGFSVKSANTEETENFPASLALSLSQRHKRNLNGGVSSFSLHGDDFKVIYKGFSVARPPEQCSVSIGSI